MTLPDAQAKAKIVLEVLRPLCLRCEIAGSVRRQKPDDIADIEIVLIPSPRHYYELARVINGQWGEPEIGRWPSKYCKIRNLSPDGGWLLDIFTTSPDCWGLIYFIRTGPAEYVCNALAVWKAQTGGGFSRSGRLHYSDGSVAQPTPQESDVFRLLGWPFIEPQDRQL